MADCLPMPAPPPAADEDSALMLAFGRGDALAFDQLYQRHHQALYRFVRRLLGREAGTQADEVFQDTWLRVVQQRQRYNATQARFRTWLFTLAHHRAMDVLRRSGREVSSPGDDTDAPWEPAGAAAWSQWPAAAAMQDDQVFWRRAGQRLLDCLEQLPPPQKTAFLLHHEEGLPLDELAQALELGYETVKSRLRYALGKLRQCMGAYLAPETGA
ncbi:RNA polymerase sigma factor, sigma-70 family [Burkholderiales bacterium JOSHI_001]|nr:RNA polymerase sigma factor, sigma-70 family [Burkholderiales bacterium JOSHI_001]